MNTPISSMLKLRLEAMKNHLNHAFQAMDNATTKQAKSSFTKARIEALELARLSNDADVKELYLKEAEKIQRLLDKITEEEPIENSITIKEDSKDKPEHTVFTPIKSDLNFSDVIGMEEVKKELLQRMKLPFEYAEQAKRWEIQTGGGILLYGPPGTGKTFIARAAAGELDAAFIPVKAADLMSKWVGEAEKNIAALFATAREYDRCIIFIDELEALVPKRGKNSSTIMARVVPQFLAETDGVEGKQGNILIMGATNHPWMIDEAMLRGGRLDALIYVGLPDLETRTALFERYLQNKPIEADVDFSKLAELGEGLSAADIKNMSNKVAMEGFEKSLKDVQFVLKFESLRQSVENMRLSVSKRVLDKFHNFNKINQ